MWRNTNLQGPQTLHIIKVINTVGKGRYGQFLDLPSFRKSKEKNAADVIHTNGELTIDDALRQIKIMKDITHRNIVKITEAFKEWDDDKEILQLHLLLEYCENGNLENFIKNRNLKAFTSETVQKWMTQLSSGIGYLHSKNVIHGNLKLSNVFLDEERNLKIGDLFKSKEVPSSAEGGAAGTGNGNFCFEADIYSFGEISLCMVTLKVSSKTEHGEFVTFPPKISYGQTKYDIINDCLDSDLTKRPTAAQILKTLETDSYEMLCFHSVYAPNASLYGNKTMANKKESDKNDALVFSNRPLQPDEKFCVEFQKVRAYDESRVTFGLTTKNPWELEKDVPRSVDELTIYSQTYVYELNKKVTPGKKLTFWYDEDDTVWYEYDDKPRKFSTKASSSTNKWAFFNLCNEVYQIDLQDYVPLY